MAYAPMDELITWFREQVDLDEQLALAAAPGPWHVTRDPLGVHVENGDGRGRIVMRSGRDRTDDVGDNNAAHIACHDPARTLRDVEAYRAIIDLVLDDNGIAHTDGIVEGESDSDPDCRGRLLRAVAAVYVDRPGYRQEWTP